MALASPSQQPDVTVVIIGAGGLGCPVSLALCEAGVAITLIDDDVVDVSNLQRQVLYTTDDVGRVKVEAARERLEERVPGARVSVVRSRLDADNVDALLGGAELVVDATDDPAARFVINDWAVANARRAVLGGVHRFQGLVMGVAPGSACFRCLFEEDQAGTAPTCAQVGVIGALVGLVGHLEAERALALLGDEPDTTGYVTTIDALAPANRRTRRVAVPRDPLCPACGAPPRARLAVPRNLLSSHLGGPS